MYHQNLKEIGNIKNSTPDQDLRLAAIPIRREQALIRQDREADRASPRRRRRARAPMRLSTALRIRVPPMPMCALVLLLLLRMNIRDGPCPGARMRMRAPRCRAAVGCGGWRLAGDPRLCSGITEVLGDRAERHGRVHELDVACALRLLVACVRREEVYPRERAGFLVPETSGRAALVRVEVYVPGEVGVKVGYGEEEVQPDDYEDKHEGDKSKDGPLEPALAVFEIEPHLHEIAEELRVVRQLFADGCAGRGMEDGIGRDDGDKCTKRKVCDGVVAVEAYVRRLAFDDADETDDAHHD